MFLELAKTNIDYDYRVEHSLWIANKIIYRIKQIANTFTTLLFILRGWHATNSSLIVIYTMKVGAKLTALQKNGTFTLLLLRCMSFNTCSPT